MHQPWRHRWAGPIAAALMALPVASVAQYGQTFRQTPQLTSSDIAMVRKLVRQDLTGKPNGTKFDWSNPESENSGTVTLIDSFRSDGRDCRRVRYVINPGKNAVAAQSITYDLNSCRLADGSWKLDADARPDPVGR